ncbi:MAG TPA: hypothetical protein VKZ67_00250 [Natronosporangium sp.]|nr:hypothetical protein [Natronosporangium sp.]
MTSTPGVLPLRPLTFGELLDAAVSLLRVAGLRLLAWGGLVALVEQLVLFPLRRWADLDLRFLPASDRWSVWGLLLVVGCVTELAAITVLAGRAGSVAPHALLGPAAPAPSGRGRRWAGVTVVAAIVATILGLVSATVFGWPPTYFLLAFLTVPLWLWCYGSFGLVAPAVVVDQVGPLRALGRSVVLSSRGFARVLRIRVSAYLGWLVIRVAWGYGVLSALELVWVPQSTTEDAVVISLVYLLVNACGYPALACLDVMLHLEARMRTEGLDLALRRSLARGTDPTPVLVRP